MKPLGLLAAILVLGVAGAVFLLAPRTPEITVTDAVLSPMGSSYALTAKIDNPGGPDRLIAAGSAEAERTMIAGTDRADVMAIPAGSTPSLAMDGAHGMFMGLPEDMAEGRLVPVTLVFENAGEIATRARVAAVEMDHGEKLEAGDEAPELEMSVTADGDGWAVSLEVSDFVFSREAVDGPHQPGVGHGHLYLNGLKLQRMYGTEARIGMLPTGSHEVRVVLNTNDHRAYARYGQPVAAVARIEVD
ncbi:MAG: copper chaperone PCu(A)C [Rhodobacter sp.]|nr:copper chaperone PCu(A)C [Rhodobacter sp.]